jgi:hypothetical protein
MRLKRESENLQFTFNPVEAHLLLQVFGQLTERYRLKPEEIDPRTAEAWYSTRGCRSAKMSEDETREWLAHLHTLKCGSLQRLEAWSKQIREPKPDQAPRLTIPVDDAPAFMTAINDHRLAAAARHDIGQREMDFELSLELAPLPLERQAAILEIHFLAWILEETLRALQEP